MSYGYEIGATPLQIACAYAAVANKGVLMKPFVIAKIKSADGKNDGRTETSSYQARDVTANSERTNLSV